MKTQKNRPRKKSLVISTIAIAAALIVGFCTYYYFVGQKDESTDTTSSQQAEDSEPEYTDGPTDDQIKDGTDIKQQAIDKSKNEETNEGKEIGIVITRAAQSNGEVQVRVLLEAITSGTCSLAITNGGESYSKSADTQTLSSSTTCKGFDIPVSELGTGTWNIKVSFSSDLSSSSTASTILEVN